MSPTLDEFVRDWIDHQMEIEEIFEARINKLFEAVEASLEIIKRQEEVINNFMEEPIRGATERANVSEEDEAPAPEEAEAPPAPEKTESEIRYEELQEIIDKNNRKIVITETADGISQNFLNSGQLLTDAVWHWLNSNYVSHNSASSLFDHVAVTPSGGRS